MHAGDWTSKNFKKDLEKITKEKNLDILIFAHTHHPFFMEKEGKIYINPGSPTNPLPPLIIKLVEVK